MKFYYREKNRKREKKKKREREKQKKKKKGEGEIGVRISQIDDMGKICFLAPH